MALADELALALELADAADALTLPPFEAREVTYDWKANHTEVTALDRAAERVIADRLAAERPHHQLLGEEFGVAGEDARRGDGSSIRSTARPATCAGSRSGRR